MSNFDFLKDFDTTLWKLGNRIEKIINISPSGVKADATTFLEYILKQYLSSVNIPYNSRKSFSDQMYSVVREGGIHRPFANRIINAYNQRNKIHDDFEVIEKNEYATALDLHKKLFYIAKKFYRDSDEYDEYKGVPQYKAPVIDLSDDEIELLEIPDFDEIIEFSYDYCVVCGKPNHSNYSIYCEDCNRKIDNANNFISIRNSFGKNSRFRKEDLIEYGIHEGYVLPLINSLVKSDLFKVKGIYYEFNNLNIDSYMATIDKYIRIGELITKFREDKLTPSEMKDTKEYKQGSYRQEPYYQFFKVINEEIINKFERDLLTTENIWDSIEYTTIPQKDLKRWYLTQLNQYKKNVVNESFVVFNRLLIGDYLSLKRQGIKDKEIERQLNVSKDMLEFFPKFYPEFESELSEIKKDLILKLLDEGKSKLQVIEEAGITQKEYDDFIKYSKFKENDFNTQYEKIINERKEQLLTYLTMNNLYESCRLTKVTVDDFYQWLDDEKDDSEFYIKSNKILMEKYLDERKSGKTKSESCEHIAIDEAMVDKWLKRKNKLFDEFKEKNLRIIIDLVLNGFKHGRFKKVISKDVDVPVEEINRFLSLGKKGSKVYAELYEYYESEVVPKQLSRFLDEIKSKPFNKVIYRIDLTKDELGHYYQTNQKFHEEYLSIKMDKYVEEILDGRTHERSLKRSDLTREEYLQLKQKIDEILLHKRMEIVKRVILNDSKSDVAAKRAGVKVDDVYDWYYKGKSDEKFREFSEFFYDHYIEPNVLWVNRLLSRNHPMDKILKIFDINFTEKDFEIWQKEGLINAEDVIVDLNDDEDEDKKISIIDSHNSKIYSHESSENTWGSDDKNSDLYKTVHGSIDEDDEIKRKDLFSNHDKSSSTILKKDEKDIEKLKKEILGKK